MIGFLLKPFLGYAIAAGIAFAGIWGIGYQIKKYATLEANFENYKVIVEKEREFHRAKDRQAKADSTLVGELFAEKENYRKQNAVLKDELRDLQGGESSEVLKETIRRLK